MTEDQVRERVRGFIVMNFLFGDESQAPADTESLLGSGILDSTGLRELVDSLEVDLGITAAETETVPANLDRIANLRAYVTSKRDPVDA